MPESKLGDLRIVKRKPEQIVAAWEALAYQAERDKDYVLAQSYFQQAEHWKRV